MIDLKIKLEFFGKFLKPRLPGMVIGLVLSFCAVGFGLISPLMAAKAIDLGIAKNRTDLFLFFSAIGGLVFLIAVICQSYSQFIRDRIRSILGLALGKYTARQLLFSSQGILKDKTIGAEMYQVEHDASNCADFLITSFPDLLFSAIKAIALFIVLCFINLWLAIISLCLIPMLYLIPYFSAKIRLPLQEKFFLASEDLASNSQEMFSRIYITQAFNRQFWSLRRFMDSWVRFLRIYRVSSKIDLVSGGLAEITAKFCAGCVAVFAGLQISGGHLTYGGVAAGILYAYQLLGAHHDFAGLLANIPAGLVSLRRLSVISDEDSLNKMVQKEDFLLGNIGLQKINFGYEPGKFVLKDFSCDFPAEKHSVIFGPSGCGKTTLINLIMRLYQESEGGIFAGGNRLTQGLARSWRENLGYAGQEPWLFNCSVADNIDFADPGISKQDIIKALNISLALEFVEKMPKGIDSLIGEAGAKLSHGQRQRIAIARAVAKRPKVFLFDEAFSAVDQESEKRILKNIREEFPLATIITISHRKESIMAGDWGVFIDLDGKYFCGLPSEILKNHAFFNR
jgi:ATP-binding cassette, subfamily B, multidrug efflux pump